MTRDEVCARIREVGIVPAIRTASRADAQFAVEAVAHAGIPVVEVTMTIPGAVHVIEKLAHANPSLIVGAGTVLTPAVARRCVDAGAAFLTAPGFDREIVEFAGKVNVASMPGALTPTEVVAAWRAGADFVKLFPCAPVGGGQYVKSLKTSLPQVHLIAAGGVNQRTATEFLVAGACAIGVGTELIPKEAVAQRRPEQIRELARRFLGYVKEARARLEGAARDSD